MPEDIKSIFSNNLNDLMNQRKENVTDVSERTGIAYSTVNDWKNGKKMARGGNLQKLADYFGVNISDLTSSEPFNKKLNNMMPVNVTIKIPVIGEIACGDPILADENIIEYREEVEELLPSGNLFFLHAKGDSMSPTIPNGSFVLIREQADVENGDIAAVLVNGDTEATLKRIKKQGDIVMLIPDNNEYSPYIVNKDNPARILGKAVKLSIDL